MDRLRIQSSACGILEPSLCNKCSGLSLCPYRLALVECIRVGWLPCLAAVLPPKITIALYNKAFDVSERNGRLDAGRISGPPQLGLTSEFSQELPPYNFLICQDWCVNLRYWFLYLLELLIYPFFFRLPCMFVNLTYF
jgi:hypothetical protein